MIFNSLGSNYSLEDALLALKELTWPNQKSKMELKQKLQKEYGGEVILLFSGRDAIEYCLKAYGIKKNDTVLSQAFSCSSIEEAVNRVGAKVEYFDLSPDAINTTLSQVKLAHDRSSNPKVIILQHGLGYVDEIVKIKEFCLKNDLILIEDLAQAVGADDDLGGKVGSYGDAVILSFGRDKILDGITGGAVIFRTNSKVPYSLPELTDWFELEHDRQNKKQVLKLLLYPSFTFIIRSTYRIGVGKMIHRLAKKGNLMASSIISTHDNYQSFPTYFAPLVIRKLETINSQLNHRRKISLQYYQQLTLNNLFEPLVDQKAINRATNLRFPLLLDSEEALNSLIDFLKTREIYLEDRWYKSPVDSGSLEFASSYQSGSCPNAEKLSKRLLNLPTHHGLSVKEANKIIDAIKCWKEQR
ncbi:MAG: DegT/DnrJ/eryc1/StrS aminotransferase [Microgenomates bacterium 39_7]|nr:MAG: DegT/DnrJ/eryc1/StrS aminotransferase [Microgenomates bacterium 39_7]